MECCFRHLVGAGMSRSFLEEAAMALAASTTTVVLLADRIDIRSLLPKLEQGEFMRVIYGCCPTPLSTSCRWPTSRDPRVSDTTEPIDEATQRSSAPAHAVVEGVRGRRRDPPAHRRPVLLVAKPAPGHEPLRPHHRAGGEPSCGASSTDRPSHPSSLGRSGSGRPSQGRAPGSGEVSRRAHRRGGRRPHPPGRDQRPHIRSVQTAVGRRQPARATSQIVDIITGSHNSAVQDFEWRGRDLAATRSPIKWSSSSTRSSRLICPA